MWRKRWLGRAGLCFLVEVRGGGVRRRGLVVAVAPPAARQPGVLHQRARVVPTGGDARGGGDEGVSGGAPGELEEAEAESDEHRAVGAQG